MPTNTVTAATNGASATATATATAAPSASHFVDKATDYIINNSPKLLGGIIILLAGILVSRWIGKLITRALERHQLEPPVLNLIVKVSRLLIFMLALIIALETCGFHMTALITGIGVAGVGIGFAMQGLLSNMVAGLTIIFTKPFRVGEYIEILNVQGLVTQVDLVSTVLVHSDTSRVVIPNHKIIGEILHNFGTVRQLDLAVGIGYETDMSRAQAVIGDILRANNRILREPPPVIAIKSLGDSSIILAVKPWVKITDAGPAQNELNQAIVEAFRLHKIEIPYPQREIRILNPSPQS